MRHLTIRLQLVWLTLAALGAFVLMAVTRPDAAVVNLHLARNLGEFVAVLGAPVGIAALNQVRGALAADMVFLLAYGILLRQSVLYAGRHRWTRLAQYASVVVMAADGAENLAALTVLRDVETNGSSPAWLFLLMNAAAIVKWALLGGVMLFLATRWRSAIGSFKGSLRHVAVATVLAFAAGGLGSIAVAVSSLAPGLRGLGSAASVLGLAVALLLQFRLVDFIGVGLRLVYLARVPFIVLFITAGFGPLSLGPAAPLLGAILDVPSGRGIGVVTAAVTVLAFACATQINIVRAYGPQRTFDRTLLVLEHRALGRAASWTALAAAASLLFSVGVASLWMSTWNVVGGILGGAVFGVLFLFLLEWISLFMSDRRPDGLMPQLAIPFLKIPFVGDWLRRAHAAPPSGGFKAVNALIHRWSIAGRLFGLASGYIEALPNGTRRLLPGHTFAIVQFFLSALFYAVLIFGKRPGNVAVAEDRLWVPTAGSVVMLLVLNSWGLSGLAFFLDRYRVPLLTALLALTVATGSSPRTDYEVRTQPPPAADPYTLATPAEVLTAFPRPLVLAAAGGGIQAGAWAARVLEGIDEKLKDGGLRPRAALVSGVSGGSMGALYYGAYLDDRVRTATERSLEPSLDEIASALIGVDHLRRVFGIRVGVDRGAALERSWALRLPKDDQTVTLRRWSDRVRRFARREDASARPFPAFLFNATVVETGAPVAFVTTQFPTRRYRDSFASRDGQHPVAESANHLFGLSADGHPQTAKDAGIQMVTAARLSAAFPYVSPAAALKVEGSKPFHLVDGGYYDNYGLASVTQWLDDALALMPETSRPSEIGVVLIRGLEEVEAERPDATSRGWAWQLIAPPVAFLRTRSFGQWAGGMQALKLLADKWQPRVALRLYLFDFPSRQLPASCKAAPLSWKLSKPQAECIGQAWPIVAASPSVAPLWNPAPIDVSRQGGQ